MLLWHRKLAGEWESSNKHSVCIACDQMPRERIAARVSNRLCRSDYPLYPIQTRTKQYNKINLISFFLSSSTISLVHSLTHIGCRPQYNSFIVIRIHTASGLFLFVQKIPTCPNCVSKRLVHKTKAHEMPHHHDRRGNEDSNRPYKWI